MLSSIAWHSRKKEEIGIHVMIGNGFSSLITNGISFTLSVTSDYKYFYN